MKRRAVGRSENLEGEGQVILPCPFEGVSVGFCSYLEIRGEGTPLPPMVIQVQVVQTVGGGRRYKIRKTLV